LQEMTSLACRTPIDFKIKYHRAPFYSAQKKIMLHAKELYQQANQLPPLEKLRLAESLLADLDIPDPEIDAFWRNEAQKRWQAYQAGDLKTVCYDAVMKKYN